MLGNCIKDSVQDWFEFKVPSTTHSRKWIKRALQGHWKTDAESMNHSVIWLGSPPVIDLDEAEDEAIFTFHTKSETFSLEMNYDLGEWLYEVFASFYIHNEQFISLKAIAQNFEDAFGVGFDHILESEVWETLREKGLLLIRF